MSRVVFVAKSKEASSATLMALKKATGRPLGEIKTAIATNQPFYEVVLFENNHVEVDENLRNFMQVLTASSLEVEVYELDVEERFDDAPLDVCLISIEVLTNILNEAVDQFS